MVDRQERIRFDNVSMSYRTVGNDLEVARDISFNVCQEDFISLVGPSGCGKTTMMNMAAGFLQPTAGQVTLDGKIITGPGPDRGVMFQEYGVFPWLTVRGNIEFGLKLKANRVSVAERNEIVDHYIELMGLSDFHDAYPKMLSGGMRQRLALARAYTTKPEFLFMDEPFGALDAQTRIAMQNLLLKVLAEEGKTVLLITHSVEEAIYLSSEILVISARPSRIRERIKVPFPYPRDPAIQETHEFRNLYTHITDIVMKEYAIQQRQVISQN